MKLRAFILTCPARAGTVCPDTLRAFARTDWPAPLEVFLNESDAPLRHKRITVGMLALLRRALETGADAFLLCEDDTRFNLHLHHNLATWPPLRRGALALGSLCNPGATGRSAPVAGDTALLVEPELAIGAQARVFTRACAAHILSELPPQRLAPRQAHGTRGEEGRAACSREPEKGMTRTRRARHIGFSAYETHTPNPRHPASPDSRPIFPLDTEPLTCSPEYPPPLNPAMPAPYAKAPQPSSAE